MSLEQIGAARSFGGRQLQFRHASSALGCPMVFSVYLPPQAEVDKVPVLWWLSGLTCTDQNFVTKAGAQQTAAETGVAVIAPDTSPRGEGVPGDPDGAWDFGLGAGFYVNATEAPWSRHYRMYDYIATELPALVGAELPLDMSRQAISGHSMGGHGALVIGLREQGRFRSISAFSPIASSSRCPWGEKALGRYLGPDRAAWQAYDASALLAAAKAPPPILVDQGEADGFLASQLKPELLEEAARRGGHAITLRRQPGYDHSYYFIATFIGDHIGWHATRLYA